MAVVALQVVMPVLLGQEPEASALASAADPPGRQPLRPGTVFADPLRSGGSGPALVLLPGGRTLMGSPDSETGRLADEGPQHEVLLRAFALGRTEVTVAQFGQFVEATGYRTDAERNTPAWGGAGATPGCLHFGGRDAQAQWIAGVSWKAPGFAQAPDHPAVCLSWNDARAYAAWLAAATGQRYRLPSEAEQEYAIRAGADTRHPWGRMLEAGCRYGNGPDRSARTLFAELAVVECSDGHAHTSPAGRFEANAFGLFDTIGNAWEWSADCRNPGYQGAPADGAAWTGGDCSGRMLRGAAWLAETAQLRAAARHWNAPGYRSSVTGMRIARDS